MLSQVAGAAKNGGTPLETEGAPPPTIGTDAIAATTSPTADEVRPIVAGNGIAHGNRKTAGATTFSKNSANREFQFFFDDEVFNIDRKGRVCFGIVTGTAESYSSDDDDDEEVNDVLSKGEVRVAFYPEGKEIVRTEKSVSQLRLL